MSNRLSKGKVLAGSFSGDLPGNDLSGVRFSASSTSVQTTSFKFNTGDLISDVYVKVTSVAATSQSISIGLATTSTSTGVGTALASGLVIGTSGTFVLCATSSAGFTYGTYLTSSTAGAVTTLKGHAVGSADTYVYLN